jgi:glutathione peroxidase-family protein
MSTTTTPISFYDLKADLPGGKVYDFSQLKGKVVLIVNVASAWYDDSRFIIVTRVSLTWLL